MIISEHYSPVEAYDIAYRRNKRWPSVERFILPSPVYSYYYAVDLIKGRWLEAERRHIKEPRFSIPYATFVLNRRWAEAEDERAVPDPVRADG